MVSLYFLGAAQSVIVIVAGGMLAPLYPGGLSFVLYAARRSYR